MCNNRRARFPRTAGASAWADGFRQAVKDLERAMTLVDPPLPPFGPGLSRGAVLKTVNGKEKALWRRKHLDELGCGRVASCMLSQGCR